MTKFYNNVTGKAFSFAVLKRFVVTILTLIYLGTATGTSVNLHYCMGKLAELSLWQNESKTCGKCGMEEADNKDNGCCKDEHKQLKVDDDHKLAASIYSWNILSAALPTMVFFHFNFTEALFTSEEFPVSNAPPFVAKTPTYLRLRVFLI